MMLTVIAYEEMLRQERLLKSREHDVEKLKIEVKNVLIDEPGCTNVVIMRVDMDNIQPKGQ